MFGDIKSTSKEELKNAAEDDRVFERKTIKMIKYKYPSSQGSADIQNRGTDEIHNKESD